MSIVKVEPFYFGSEEDNIQLDTEKLPGATKEQEESKETEAKPDNTTETEETQDSVVIEKAEEEEVEDDNIDPLGIFNKVPKKESKESDVEVKEKVSSDKVDFKAITDFLVETDIFKDFDERESIEYTEESFQALWKAQTENKVKEQLFEERSQFGDTANQLIDYLKNGGTVDDFVGNYSQQVDIASIDTSDSDGQEKVIKEYYKSLDWEDKKIKKHIERLKDSGDSDFKEEADDCKTKLVEAIEEDREQMLKEQESINKDKKIRIERFNKAVREEIYKDTTLADREKKDLDKFVYDYKYQDKETGYKYSEFAVRMNEINQDPKKYQKFLKFLKNIDSFEDKKTAEKEVTKKTFNFLKNGTNSLEGAQSKEPVKNKPAGSPPGFKFK